MDCSDEREPARRHGLLVVVDVVGGVVQGEVVYCGRKMSSQVGNVAKTPQRRGTLRGRGLVWQ